MRGRWETGRENRDMRRSQGRKEKEKKVGEKDEGREGRSGGGIGKKNTIIVRCNFLFSLNIL